MKKILLLGAGRSSSALIHYLLNNCESHNWELVVGDVSEAMAREKTSNHPRSKSVSFDVNNAEAKIQLVKNADLVISLLPPHLHYLVAEVCIDHRKHFLTASYMSREMEQLDEKARNAGVLILNECGLDPGIDHMSAMEIIHRLQSENAVLTCFKSYTGGLVAPESNDNPWGYKFSWNPKNVILAGQGTARYIRDNKYRYIPYNRLFEETEQIRVDGCGSFDGYANRDSLAYRHHYGIENIPTLIRGTLRQSGYCRAWNVFVKLGLTDDSYKIEKSESMTYAELIRAFLPKEFDKKDLLEAVAAFCHLPPDGESMTKIQWTGILSDDPVPLSNASPAEILQELLERKWKLQLSDKDMIVMHHYFEYQRNGKIEKLTSSLVVKGEDQQHTAMAKTVGLPLGIAAKLLLENKIQLTGVHIPVKKEIYEPVLKELSELGIKFHEITM